MDVIYMLFSKVFVFMLAGCLLGRIRVRNVKRAIDVAVDIILYFLMPCFVLVVLWESNISIGSIGNVGFAAMIVVGTGLIFALVFSRLSGLELREVCLPIMFMNSAFIGIPLNMVLFGAEGAAYAVIYSTTTTLCHFTLGVSLVSRKSGFKEIFRLPIVYAAILGVVLNVCRVSIPGLVVGVNYTLKAVTIPAMLIFVGYNINFRNTGLLKLAFAGSVFRFSAGLAASLAVVRILSMGELSSKVVIVSSVMPTAVIAYILSKKYDANPEFASAMILVSTLSGVLVVLGVNAVFL